MELCLNLFRDACVVQCTQSMVYPPRFAISSYGVSGFQMSLYVLIFANQCRHVMSLITNLSDEVSQRNSCHKVSLGIETPYTIGHTCSIFEHAFTSG